MQLTNPSRTTIPSPQDPANSPNEMQHAFCIGFQSLIQQIGFDAGVIIEQNSNGQCYLISSYGAESVQTKKELYARVPNELAIPRVYDFQADAVTNPVLLHFAPEGTASGLAVPLSTNGDVTSLLILYTCEADHFESVDIALLQSHTVLFRLILESKRATDQAARQTDELQTLATISVALKSANTASEITPIFLSKIVELLNVQNSMLFRYERKSNMLETWATYPQQIQRRIHLSGGAGFIGRAITSQEPVFLSAASAQSIEGTIQHRNSIPLVDEVNHLGLENGAVALPMETSQGQMIGVLVVHLCENQTLIPEEISLLQAIARMAANVLNRASEKDSLEQSIAERTKELLIVNEQLLELDRLKNKFIEDMSHEFRTPLTSIGLYLGLLEKEASEKSNRYIEALKRQTAQLSSLVNTILDISNPARTGGLGDFETVELSEITDELYRTYEPYAEVRSLKLICPQNDPCTVQGNPEVLRRMISNLLDNAINYTAEGTICLSLVAKGGQAALSVSDTGLGIPKEELTLLFDRFYRGRQVSQLSIPGSGLGLSMVKQIVDQHNGQIKVESIEGQGSTFRINLPVAEPMKMAKQAVA